ncbi:MAG: hypothetical protein IIC79_00785 [Chloroflexi bacterium]|nr:hypothetical protein [Chloroflexota bacterium]
MRNNVTRMLDAKGIPYKVHELPNKKLGALDAARFLSIPDKRMYKTIVATRKDGGKPILALVLGTAAVEPKALARALGATKVHISSLREAEELTGLQTGGISPLALLQKGFQVVMDSSVNEHEQVYISGGQRGVIIQISADELIKITNARVVKITR